jgi:hypothetical protein
MKKLWWSPHWVVITSWKKTKKEIVKMKKIFAQKIGKSANSYKYISEGTRGNEPEGERDGRKKIEIKREEE